MKYPKTYLTPTKVHITELISTAKLFFKPILLFVNTEERY